MSLQLDSPGRVDREELERLSRSVRAGWRVDRLDSSLWDRGPAVTLASGSSRVLARRDGELVGAVAVGPDPVSTRLYARESWRVSALIARDPGTEAALLAEASELVLDCDLFYFRFSEIGEVSTVGAPAFAVIGRGALFGKMIDSGAALLAPLDPARESDRDALVSIARESAEHPEGTSDEASLERARENDADTVDRALKGSGSLVVTRDGARVTGFAVLSGSGTAGCIDLLGVARAARRRGFGARLVSAAETVGRGEGWVDLLLATRRGNHAAISLYASTGFSEIGDLLLMRRQGRPVPGRECTGTGATDGRDG